MKDVHEGTSEPVKKVDVDEEQRALGVQVSMAGYWQGALNMAADEVAITARAISQMPPVKSLVERCGKAVGWQRMLYRVRLLTIPVGKVRVICQPLRRAVLAKVGLPPGTAGAAADSFVWMAEEDELAAERIIMLMKMLGADGVAGKAMGGSVRKLQRFSGSGRPVLETKLMQCTCVHKGWKEKSCTEAQRSSVGEGRCPSVCGWNSTWTGSVYDVLSNSDFSLVGGAWEEGTRPRTEHR